MLIVVLVTLVFLLLLVFRLTAGSHRTPWGDQMTRLNPGTSFDHAEWMAPGDVVQAVQRDYMSFYQYVAEKLPQGWLEYMRDLNEYLCEDLLREQRESLDTRLRHNRGRMIDILRANHSLQVRHFSDDGTRCIIIDHQTEQRMATYDYWSGNRLHTQDLGSTTYVYEMQYDLRAQKWKLARFIQVLPPGSFTPGRLDFNLPQTLGRDQ